MMKNFRKVRFLTKAKYVRYVGHGVDDSATGNFVRFYSSITEFIINE